MTAFVLDVSVTMAWCFKDEASDATWALLDRLAVDTAIVPGIWSAEVANVLLVAERRRRIDRAKARTFVARLMALPIAVEETAPDRMLSEVLSIGRETRLAAYDALYLDLAIRHGTPLATTDLALRTAARKMRVAIVPA
ncbi:type II toxin-antitoxin system VapC family toxin [Reyranella sp.]|uniref:type II toxin-antitoxin system VapC family toxin n=1 Tax=Reyranella sp. TaxID=1929291 RepID=UPI003D0E537A